MKSNRRKFLRNSILSAGLMTSGLISCSPSEEKNKNNKVKEKSREQIFNMCGYRAPCMDVVRVGIIGLGTRGNHHLNSLTHLENVKIVALCDIYEERVEKCQKRLEVVGLPRAESFFGTSDKFKELCESPNIDLVVVATPWAWHSPMAVYSMENGKHVATEIPAAKTIEECWQLVETSERTKKHCMMMENCCYGFFELLTLNMARQGFFGDIVHGEGAYIHDLKELLFDKNYYQNMWRLKENISRNGNLYPTHGLGPICQIMGINRGDKMEYLASTQSEDFQMAKLIEEKAAQDSFFKEFAGKGYRGNMNTSIVRTNKGKTIKVQHDVSSTRPYSRIHLVQGTEASAFQYPLPGGISKGHEWLDEEEVNRLSIEYQPEILKRAGEMAKIVGGHGGMDFIMFWRLIDCLRNGLPLDQDVYDAASWSSVGPLSEWSVVNHSKPIDFPDFTCGSWKNNTPVDLQLKEGGTTTMRI
jgi:hypothetical protein